MNRRERLRAHSCKACEPLRHDEQGIDVLPAFLYEGAYFIPCRYCRRWHQHGMPAGHRRAHCEYADSPYLKKGYVLEDAGALTQAVRKAHFGYGVCAALPAMDQLPS